MERSLLIKYMANLVITSTTNSIKVEFNSQYFFDKRDGLTYKKGCWSKSEIGDVKLQKDENYVVVMEKDGFEWLVSQDGYAGTLTIDSIDGVSPSSNSDLYDKLIALIA